MATDSSTLADNSILKALVGDKLNLPYSTLSGLANAQNQNDVQASNLSDIAGGIQNGGILAALVKGATSGVALTKKEQAQQQRDTMNQHIQALTDYQVQNQKHQAEMQDLIDSHVAAQANQGAFVDGMNSLMQGGDPQALVDLTNSEPVMARTAARQFGVDPANKLVDLQVTKDRNGQEHIIGSFADANGQKFTAPAQIPAADLMKAVAAPVLAQRASEAAKNALETQKTMAGIQKDQAAAAKDINDVNHPKGQNPPTGYAFNPDGSLHSIKGGPADASIAHSVPSGTEAGQLAIVKQGQDAIGDIKNLMFDKNGDLNKGVVTEAAGINVPLVGKTPAFSDAARKLRTAFYNMANAKLRLESGAAVPESEVQRTADAYLASALDSDATAQFKLQAPEQYFKDFLATSGRSSAILTPPVVAGVTDATPTSTSTLQAPAFLQTDKAATIKAEFQANKITREQARAQLQALGQ